MQTKKEIRACILKLRDQISLEDRNAFSEKIACGVCESNAFIDADAILSFASFGSEVNTDMIFETATKSGKPVYFPKVVENDMIFYRITSKEQFEKGYKDILEPKGDTESFDANAFEKIVMIMPGVCFDKSGHRIGYGKGFYDRYLASFEQKAKLYVVAIAFSSQVVEEGVIPYEAHDLLPDMLITECETYQISEV